MKVHRCILCLVITLMSVLHCSCQSSEERPLTNEANYPEIDRSKLPLASLSGLLDSLEHASSGSRQINAGGIAANNPLLQVDPEIPDPSDLAARLGYAQLNNDIKRSWNKMNAAWGKRVTGGNRNAGWTKFGAAWGKREPGWNNLKGLWGKRTDKWDKLASAWGKRQEMSRSY
ncbi:uncharacterized protein LOC128728852 [Anopheles nili]|uniref:uncharacterized protein LOC128728852 n=1 Tax=Anopheles nili TaxID=185578 RepID=UPI00237B54BD|nr:uncharacterized protein LOC128728852 [Anopheles nili]